MELKSFNGFCWRFDNRSCVLWNECSAPDVAATFVNLRNFYCISYCFNLWFYSQKLYN